MTKSPRTFNPTEKAQIALVAIRGEKTVAQISSEYQVHPTQIGIWKKQALENFAELFKDDEFFIFKTCNRIHKELTLQVYKRSHRDEQQILEEPEKKFDEMTDNARYILNERPDYTGIAKEKYLK